MAAAFAECPVGEFAVNSECIESKFQVNTTSMSANTTFSFYLSAKGTFYVDWGDGNSQLIDRSNKTGPTQYSHSYANAGSVKIQFGGFATGYNSSSLMQEALLRALDRIATFTFTGKIYKCPQISKKMEVSPNFRKKRSVPKILKKHLINMQF